MSTLAPLMPPPLREGDRLSREEFLRRWEAMPRLKHAELIDGVVHMASPVLMAHGRFHSIIHGWLFHYVDGTPGTADGLDDTWLMLDDAVPQPDLTLRISPEAEGQSRVVGGYLAGAPELAVEISNTTISHDLGVKGDLYRRAGVREYIVVNAMDGTVLWREVVNNRFRKLASKGGILRSRVFPGLWLNTDALSRFNWAEMKVTLNQGLASPEHAAFVAKLAAPSR